MVLRMVTLQQRFLKVKLKLEILFLPQLRVQNKTPFKEVLYVKDVENKSGSMGSKGAIAWTVWQNWLCSEMFLCKNQHLLFLNLFLQLFVHV